MKLSENVRPASYFKEHVDEIINNFNDNPDVFVITQDGCPKAVLQDIVSYERTQETLRLLKILEMRRQEAEEGKYRSADKVIRELREKIIKYEST
jgi:prevent-host-death family protein